MEIEQITIVIHFHVSMDSIYFVFIAGYSGLPVSLIMNYFWFKNWSRSEIITKMTRKRTDMPRMLFRVNVENVFPDFQV